MLQEPSSCVYQIDLYIGGITFNQVRGLVLLNCDNSFITQLARDLNKSQAVGELLEEIKSVFPNRELFKAVFEIEVCYLHREFERLMLQIEVLQAKLAKEPCNRFSNKVLDLRKSILSGDEYKFLEILELLKEATK